MERSLVLHIPRLAAWVIEYAWSHRMMDILDVPSIWQKVELQRLKLEEPCSLRVAAARAWSVVNTRDIAKFESVLEVLEVTYKLLPWLVSPIKHMKIVFGLKTMIIMQMLQENQGEVGTMAKIIHFFPSRRLLYRGCSKKYLEVMRKSHCEFKKLAQTLLFEKEVRQAYVKEKMEEHYGEKYAQKVEERLWDYLQLLERELPPTTCIDQVLRQERPLLEGEQLLLEVLSCSADCIPAVLRSLLCSAMGVPRTCSGLKRLSPCTDTGKWRPRAETDPSHRPRWTVPPVGQVGEVRPCTSYSNWNRGVEERPTPVIRSGWPCIGERGIGTDKPIRNQDLPPGGWSPGVRGLTQKGGGRSQGDGKRDWERTELGHEPDKNGESPMRLCTKHQRWVRNMLQECTEEPEDLSIRVLQICDKNVNGQSQNILEECLKKVGGYSGNILEECLKEVGGGQSENILERFSEVEAEHMIDQRQVTPLASPLPLTPSHQPPRSHLRDRDTASQSDRVEMAGLGVRISLESQLFLIHSQMLQPCVRLRRLTQRECQWTTEIRGTGTPPEEEEDREEEVRDEVASSGSSSSQWEMDFSYTESGIQSLVEQGGGHKEVRVRERSGHGHSPGSRERERHSDSEGNPPVGEERQRGGNFNENATVIGQRAGMGRACGEYKVKIQRRDRDTPHPKCRRDLEVQERRGGGIRRPEVAEWRGLAGV
ncbi:hypothetical protein JZ751_021057 [Albula glossodonta]|uniref:TERF1-interacting nuclear factor 2 N-terminal domain-containing protein n=1 Tax=Albula glossodonta TaxID=121402 RepID=A0A8T2PH38_9TELE|nr:hypothetical protein JZ751_021057 [Albula glossodonta]